MQELTQKCSSKFSTYQLLITEVGYFSISNKVVVKPQYLKIHLFSLNE